MIIPLFQVLAGFIRLGCRVLTWRSQFTDYPSPTPAAARTATLLVTLCQIGISLIVTTMGHVVTNALLTYGVIWYVGHKHGLPKGMAIASLSLMRALIDGASQTLPDGWKVLLQVALTSAYFLAFFRVLIQPAELSE